MLMKTVFGWEYFCCYLGGPLDFALRDKQAAWRNVWTRDLIEMGFKPHQILDPTHKPLPKGLFEFDIDNEAAVCAHYRNQRDYDGLIRVFSQIGHIDLRMVEKSDLVLFNFTLQAQEMIQPIIDEFDEKYNCISDSINTSLAHDQLDEMREVFFKLVNKFLSIPVPTYGTVHEVVFATSTHKPTFAVWEGGKHNASAWIMWLIGHRNIFDTWEELRMTLKNISQGKEAYESKDWMLFDFGRK